MIRWRTCLAFAVALLTATLGDRASAAEGKKPAIRDLWKQSGLKPEQRQALARTICLDNLKQLGFVAKRYGDTNGFLPANWQALNRYIASPEFLVCVSDTNRIAVTTWAELKPANQTYELLSPNVRKPGPNVLVAKCPLHGHVVLATGQAFQGDYLEKNKLKIVDNKLE